MIFGTTLHLYIEKDGDDGFGIAHCEGMVVFVEGAIRGETIHARIYEIKKNYAKAHIIEIISSSPHRISPPCPYYQQCGGCCTLHMDYNYMIDILIERVVGCIEHIGGIPYGSYELLPALRMEKPFYYRNKAVFHNLNGRIGYKRKKSNHVLDIEECLLLPQTLNAVLKDLHSSNRRFSNVTARVSRKGELSTLMDGKPYIGNPALFDIIYGMRIKISPESFQQVNPLQADRLYEAALELSGEGNLCVDAYCGSGLLTLLLTNNYKKTIGIEIEPQAIGDAWDNAKINGIKHVNFILGSVDEVLPSMLLQGEKPDCIVFDPPRAGIDTCSIQAVINAAVNRIVYISCDPSTLSRDAKALTKGGYRLISVRVVDMFPWTGHVETITLFQR